MTYLFLAEGHGSSGGGGSDVTAKSQKDHHTCFSMFVKICNTAANTETDTCVFERFQWVELYFDLIFCFSWSKEEPSEFKREISVSLVSLLKFPPILMK